MKFLANENFPLPSIAFLRSSGFEVISIADNYSGSSDEQVLNLAIENDLIVLTFDRDYGELLFKYRMMSVRGVVYFRDKGKYPAQAGETLVDYMNQGLELNNFFTVFDSGGARQRKLR